MDDTVQALIPIGETTVFSSAHSLRRIDIQWCGPSSLDTSIDPFDIRILHFPPHLTSLTIDYRLNSIHFLGIVTAYPNLECITIGVIRDLESPALPDVIAVLPHLHSVDLEMEDYVTDDNEVDWVGEVFFHHTTCPALVDLRLHAKTDEAWPHLSVLSFLSRSSCNLTSLIVQWGQGFEVGFSEIFRALPSLVDLRISCESDCSSILDAMRYIPGDDRVLLPMLRSFLLFAGDRGLSGAAFVAMAESRSPLAEDGFRDISPLRKIGYYFGDHYDSDLVQRLSRLQEGGVNTQSCKGRDKATSRITPLTPQIWSW
jgi:hypothetical protein